MVADSPTPRVMGVLNVTPDSFSDGGRFVDCDRAVAHALALASEGASIIDVGGESTRPGAHAVPTDEELSRTVPVVERLSGELAGSGVRISVDTRSPSVATSSVEAGASLINDVSGSLWPLAAELNVGWVAMHSQGSPVDMQDSPSYDDVVAEVREALLVMADRALRAGVPEIWIDPGIGFGKTGQHNLALIANVGKLVSTGYPVLVGASRKRTLGDLLAEADRSGGEVPVDDRLEGSISVAVWAMQQGVRMVRAHDVLATVQAARVVSGAVSKAAVQG